MIKIGTISGLTPLNDSAFDELVTKPCYEILSQVVRDTQDCDIGLVCPAVSLKISSFIRSRKLGPFVRYKIEDVDHRNIVLEIFDERRRVKLQASRAF